MMEKERKKIGGFQLPPAFDSVTFLLQQLASRAEDFKSELKELQTEYVMQVGRGLEQEDYNDSEISVGVASAIKHLVQKATGDFNGWTEQVEEELKTNFHSSNAKVENGTGDLAEISGTNGAAAVSEELDDRSDISNENPIDDSIAVDQAEGVALDSMFETLSVKTDENQICGTQQRSPSPAETEIIDRDDELSLISCLATQQSVGSENSIVEDRHDAEAMETERTEMKDWKLRPYSSHVLVERLPQAIFERLKTHKTVKVTDWNLKKESIRLPSVIRR